MQSLVAASLAALGLFSTNALAVADDCSKPPTPLAAQGCKVLDDYMAAFNADDGKAWAATLNYPHIRIRGPVVQTWPNIAAYETEFSDAALKAKGANKIFPGWITANGSGVI